MLFTTLGFLLLIIFAFVFAVIVFFSSTYSWKIGMTIASVHSFFDTLILIHYDKSNDPYIISKPPDSTSLLNTIALNIEQFHTRNDLIIAYIIIYVIVLGISWWFGNFSSNKPTL